MTTVSSSDHDDARLTAYALGELPASDCGEIERLLASGTPEAAKAARDIALIRTLSAMMTRGLQSEMADAQVPSLSDGQRAAISKAAQSTPTLRVVRWRILGAVACAALAAGLLILVGVPTWQERNSTAATTATQDGLPQPVVATQLSQAKQKDLQAFGQADQRTSALGKASVNAPVVEQQHATDKDGSATVIAARKQAGQNGATAQDAVPLPSLAASEVASREKRDEQNLRETTNKTDSGDAARRLARAAPATPAPVPRSPVQAAPASIAVAAPPAPGASAAAPFASAPVPPAVQAPAGAGSAAASDGAGGRTARARAMSGEPQLAEREQAKSAAPGGVGASERQSLDALEKNARSTPGDDDALELVADAPRSRMALGSSTSSYMTVRRCLAADRLPPPALVHPADIIAGFPCLPQLPAPGLPAAMTIDLFPCPWNAAHQLASVRIDARPAAAGTPSPITVILVVDVSASMADVDRLAVVKIGAAQLIRNLGAQDRLAIVSCADQAQLVHGITDGQHQADLLAAIDALSAGGGSNLIAGLARADRVARDLTVSAGANRVVLCTAGAGIRQAEARSRLVSMARAVAQDGFAVSVLALGHDRAGDGDLEMVAEQGHGTFAYLANESDARRQCAELVRNQPVIVARSVVAEVSFDPAQVAAYRLVGSHHHGQDGGGPQNQANDRAHAAMDQKKAAMTQVATENLVAGQQVIGLYEIEPAENVRMAGGVQAAGPAATLKGNPVQPAMLTVSVRYQDPDGRQQAPLIGELRAGSAHPVASADARFIAAVAEFALALAHPQDQRYQFAHMLRGAHEAGSVESGAAASFLDLLTHAQAIRAAQPSP